MTGTPTTTPAPGATPGAGERPLSRRRDCDPATAHDLAALDDAGVRYEIVSSDPEATVLRLDHEALRDLRRFVTDTRTAEGRLASAHHRISLLRQQLGLGVA